MAQTSNTSGRLILVLGGARAGKSSFALRLAAESERITGGQVCFIATAQALDEDMSARIGTHRADRSSHWKTIEEPYDLDVALRQSIGSGVVIVDCLTLLVSNWLLRDEQQCAERLHQCSYRIEFSNILIRFRT